MPATVVGRDAHLDVPLTNMAVKAFQGRGEFIGQKLFPVINVQKQSNKYYTLDKNSWLLVPDTARAPKTAPRRVEFKVSSENYFCPNYALANENALEDLANADIALSLRKNSVSVVMDGLLRDLEVRIANQVTSLTNLGSGVTLSGTSQWSDFTNSDPIADVTTGHAFIQNNTGLMANTMVMDKDTFAVVRRHPILLDMFKYTSGGRVKLDQLADVFDVDTILIARGIKNTANENATGVIANIWGNNVILCRIEPGTSLETQTFGLSFRWAPAGLPAAMQVQRYRDPDPGKAVEVVSTGYYQDEKIIAADLAYGIASTIA